MSKTCRRFSSFHFIQILHLFVYLPFFGIFGTPNCTAKIEIVQIIRNYTVCHIISRLLASWHNTSSQQPYSYHERNMFTYLTLQLVVKKHCNKTGLSVVGRKLLVTYNTRGTIDHLWNKLIIRWVYFQKKKHTHCNNITQTRYFKISSRQKQHCERGGTKQWRQAPFLANDKHAHDKCSRAYSPD